MKIMTLLPMAALAALALAGGALASNGGRPIGVQMTGAGPIVVHLAAPTSGSSSGCAPVTRALAQEPIQNPGAFYVNVQDTPFPGGAVRGQLAK